jgi:hypothetical protein
MAEYGANRIRKGVAGEGKALSPNALDHDQYEFLLQAFLTLGLRGYPGISFADLVRVAQIIERDATERHIHLTHRNRAAHRRKPCAVHWFDQNWFTIKEMYEHALPTVLGPSEAVRLEPRKARVKRSKDALTSPPYNVSIFFRVITVSIDEKRHSLGLECIRATESMRKKI